MAKVIIVKDLIKKYKKADKNAVDGISFDVDEGQFFAFLGPNGAGKTTTISILTTTLSKTSGQVKIAGFDIEKESNKVRQNVGIIFQNPSLDLNLTAEENIRMHALLYGMYNFRPDFSLMPQTYKDRVLELAEILGIKQEIFKPIKTFSGGMKRKLEIMRSLMHRPKVLFLDEPTSGLDPLSRKNLWEYLTKVRIEENITIFLTTHYLEEAEEADQVCVINQGKILVDGTPTQIKKHLVKDYVEIDSKNRQNLISELKKSKYKYEENDHVKVMLPNAQIPDLIKSLKTPISLIQTHNPSLEDAYVELIEGEAKNEPRP